MASAIPPNKSSSYNYDVVRQFTLMPLFWGILGMGMGMGVFIAAQLVVTAP